MPKPKSDLDRYQFAGAGAARSAGRFDLSKVSPGDKPFSSGDKQRDRAAVELLADELDGLQNLLYADGRFKLLVILQGMDASGKDGTLRGVFGRMSALGVKTIGWKAPNETERAHDFLWRIHQHVPARGDVMVFNRSHYEDVLVPVVKGTLDADALAQRLAHINDFERLLAETGTVVLKFMLHISRKEQGRRLQQRLDDPDKTWKFDAGDLDTRAHWDDYQRAYAAAISATGTPWAPWIVVPADSKSHRNLMIATVLQATLQGLGLRYPPVPPELRGLRID